MYRFYLPIVAVFAFAIPTFIPWYFWGESLQNAFFVHIFRYVVLLHVTWLINSAAHLWGQHPYDKNINPADSHVMVYLTMGEGWHNYHHVFPWDYRTSEFNSAIRFITPITTITGIIHMFHYLGLAYDLKTVPDSVIHGRVLRTGDGTHPYSLECLAPVDVTDESTYCVILPGGTDRYLLD